MEDNFLTVTHMSDTHGHHLDVEVVSKLYDADVLVHSGDFTREGHWIEYHKFDQYIGNLKRSGLFKKGIILILGNHDIHFDDNMHKIWQFEADRQNKYTHSGYKRFGAFITNATLLNPYFPSVEIEGIHFHARYNYSPVGFDEEPTDLKKMLAETGT